MAIFANYASIDNERRNPKPEQTIAPTPASCEVGVDNNPKIRFVPFEFLWDAPNTIWNMPRQNPATNEGL